MKLVDGSPSSTPSGNSATFPAGTDRGRASDFPFFRFGAAACDTAPLAILAGGLILDSGEAERTFIYRCQDRYFAFGAAFGLHTLCFVASDAHVDRYEAAFRQLNVHLAAIQAFTGVLFPNGIAAPLYVGCDLAALTVLPTAAFRRSIADAAWRHSISGVALNQISPTYAGLLHQLQLLLRQEGLSPDWEVDAAARMGHLALRFHNKAAYVDLVAQDRTGQMPPHTRTLCFTFREFMRHSRWSEIQSHFISDFGEPARLFVKSSFDSGGNFAAVLASDTFTTIRAALLHEYDRACPTAAMESQSLEALRAEIASAPVQAGLRFADEDLRAFREEQSRKRQDVRLLVQPQIEAAAGSELPSGIGVSCFICDEGRSELIGICVQLYRDSDRRHFAAALLSAPVEARVLASIGEPSLRRLCDAFARQGYRGPIGFDARLNANGSYEFIYDCNPRLTAVFPALAIRRLLATRGLALDIVALGYRGEHVYPDVTAQLDSLRREGLLFTLERPRGVLLLPNLSRRNGYDAIAAGLSLAEVNALLASGALRQYADQHELQARHLFA